MLKLKAGEVVVLHTPDNLRLHGVGATVAAVTDWGAHVLTKAAAAGCYRAGWDEMVLPKLNGNQPPTYTATGDVCINCGGSNMRRDGKCLLCVDCGTGAGGCS